MSEWTRNPRKDLNEPTRERGDLMQLEFNYLFISNSKKKRKRKNRLAKDPFKDSLWIYSSKDHTQNLFSDLVRTWMAMEYVL